MAVTRPGANSARTREQPVAAAPSRRHGGDIIRLVAAFVLFAVTALPYARTLCHSSRSTCSGSPTIFPAGSAPASL